MAKDKTPQKGDAAADLTQRAEEKERKEAERRQRKEATKARRKIWSRSRSTIIAKVIEAKSRWGGDTIAIREADDTTYTYQKLVQGAFAMSSALRRSTERGENVGVLMPTSAAGLIAILALHVDGRVPAMLNFSAGLNALTSALGTAQIKTVLTSRKFVEIGGLEALIEGLAAKANILYLEDIKESLTTADKLRAALGEKFPGLIRRPLSPETPGVILFTSGTEGSPKGVVLTHQNLVANVEQIRDHVELEDEDIVINPLPIFHSYGLTAGCFFPLIDGRLLVPYPSPLHVKIVPEIVRKTGATIMFATDTFLHRYLRVAREGSLSSLRYAVCGAEKVRDETRNLAKRLFGFNVIEGYGATEAAPVVAANQPGDIRPGTVGKLLPGIETRIDPVEGLSEGGRLFIRGPNIMAGYLNADNPGEVTPLEDGWHDTGDIVHIDGGGYLSIRGRQKRFAKIAGEMVSLAVVENCASVVWPEHIHAAVIVPDPKKGEQIILLTEEPAPEPEHLHAWARNHGVPELAMPKRILHVQDIPVLGTGKVDYMALNAAATELIAEAESGDKLAAE